MEKVLAKLGFCDRWIHLMMEGITNGSYSVLINGESHRGIIPTRGLSQGDPFSPYLFLMCIEGLNGLIKKAATYGDIRGWLYVKQGLD